MDSIGYLFFARDSTNHRHLCSPLRDASYITGTCTKSIRLEVYLRWRKKGPAAGPNATAVRDTNPQLYFYVRAEYPAQITTSFSVMLYAWHLR